MAQSQEYDIAANDKLASPRIAIVTGDYSGDYLGGNLMDELERLGYKGTYCGLGADGMRRATFRSLGEFDRLNVNGFIRPLLRLPELLWLRRRLGKEIAALGTEVFVGIDSPDFNITLARNLKKQGLKCVQYVCPSIWAWRPSRLDSIVQAYDAVLCLFPFEVDLYRDQDISALCVGHPLAARIPLAEEAISQEQKQSAAINELRQTTDIFAKDEGTDEKLVALLPGSRPAELQKHLPLLLQTAVKLQRERSDIKLIMPLTNQLQEQLAQHKAPATVERHLESLKCAGVNITSGNAATVMMAADAAAVCMGTATLEALLSGVPHTTFYRSNPPPFVLTKFFSLPNILAQKEIVKERLGSAANAEVITEDVQALLDKPKPVLRSTFAQIHKSLRRDTSNLSAQAVMDLLS